MTTMHAWQLTKDPREIRRLGKTSEELGELQAVIARIIIQGAHEIDPSSGRTNIARLHDELADCYAQLNLTMDFYRLNRETVVERINRKQRQMTEWEKLV